MLENTFAAHLLHGGERQLPDVQMLVWMPCFSLKLELDYCLF